MSPNTSMISLHLSLRHDPKSSQNRRSTRAGTKEFMLGELGSLARMLELADDKKSQDESGSEAPKRRRDIEGAKG